MFAARELAVAALALAPERAWSAHAAMSATQKAVAVREWVREEIGQLMQIPVPV